MTGHGADLVLPRRWPLGEELAERKLRQTCHTPEEVALARRNARETAWGQAELASAVSSARRWVEMPDETLWGLVLPTTVPRRHYVNQLKGCPVHGTEIKAKGHFHPWRIDPVGHPWRIQCPVGDEWYPSNDFANGETAGGDFPDDGFAYVSPGGEHYYFLGEYAELVHLGWVRKAVSSLARAYLLTGERRYARKTAIMLSRVAEEYGHMSHVIDDRARCDCGYPRVRPREPLARPNGNGWVGFFTDRIWENDNVVLFAGAYDDIFDALTEDAADLLSFLRTQREEALAGPQRRIYSHLTRFPVPENMAQLRQSIDENMLRVMVQGLLDRSIWGNDGMHQHAMITLALVMGSPRSKELVDWCYTGPGQMQFHLPNYFFRDGSAFESLGGYNSIHIRGLNQVAMKMERLRAWQPELFPAERYPVIAEQPKHRLLYDFPIRLVLGGRFSPMVGDTGGPPNRNRPGSIQVGGDLRPSDYDSAFRLYREPRYAQALVSGKGRLQHTDLFLEPVADAVAEIVETHGSAIERRTDILDGYGLALLRSGGPENRRALAMFYGKLRGHAHDDFLDIALVGHDLSLVQCLGYPRSWHYSGKWEKNWVTHCRVGVIGQEAGFKGAVRAVAALPGLQYVDVEGLPFREARRSGFDRWTPLEGPVYRRTCALIDLSPTDFYVVDVFRVVGGSEHYWSFHGLGKTSTSGLDLDSQIGGTLAGADVAYGELSKVGEPAKQAFAFLENVRRARPDGPWGIEWRIGDSRDTRLRFTMVYPAETEAILTTGRSPSGGAPYELEFAFARRTGTAPLVSRFVSVIEAFTGSRKIDRVDPVPGGVRVTSGSRVDLIMLDAGAPGIEFEGEFGLWSDVDGHPSKLALINGNVLRRGSAGIRMDKPRIAGEVVAVDRTSNVITVSGVPAGSVRTGGFVMLGSGGRRSCYRVLGAETRDGVVRLRLGDDPLIGEGDATGFSDGSIHSGTHFPLDNHRYYHGARVAGGNGPEEYRVASVTSGRQVFLQRRDVPASELRGVVGEGGRFRIYDYGVGDEVHTTNTVCVEATE